MEWEALRRSLVLAAGARRAAPCFPPALGARHGPARRSARCAGAAGGGVAGRGRSWADPALCGPRMRLVLRAPLPQRIPALVQLVGLREPGPCQASLCPYPAARVARAKATGTHLVRAHPDVPGPAALSPLVDVCDGDRGQLGDLLRVLSRDVGDTRAGFLIRVRASGSGAVTSPPRPRGLRGPPCCPADRDGWGRAGQVGVCWLVSGAGLHGSGGPRAGVLDVSAVSRTRTRNGSGRARTRGCRVRARPSVAVSGCSRGYGMSLRSLFGEPVPTPVRTLEVAPFTRAVPTAAGEEPGWFVR